MRLSRRQFLLLSLVVPFGSLPLSGCSKSPPLKVARHIWPGYEFLEFAQQSGFYQDSAIEFLHTTSASQSMQAILNGQVDAAALTLDEVLQVRSQGLSLTIVLVFDISSGADLVVAKPHIKTLQQLKGQRVGVETSALGRLVLAKLLKRAGLSKQDVDIVPIAIDQHKSAWQDNQIDAVITFEPEASKLIKLGGVNLFDSRQMPETIFDVLAVRTDRLMAQKNNLCTLSDGHFKALKTFVNNPIDTSYRLAGRMQLTGTEVLRVYHRLHLPSKNLNSILLTDHGRVYQVAQDLNELMHQQNLILSQSEGVDTLQNLVSTLCLSKEVK